MSPVLHSVAPPKVDEGSARSPEKRGARRFLTFGPVRVSNVRDGATFGVTRDISLSGAFLLIPDGHWEEGACIDYVVQFPFEQSLIDSAWVLCFGVITRVEKAGHQYGIAVKTEWQEVLGGEVEAFLNAESHRSLLDHIQQATVER
jgi:hypothetical protein